MNLSWGHSAWICQIFPGGWIEAPNVPMGWSVGSGFPPVPSPENFLVFDLKMVNLDVFWRDKFKGFR